MEKLSHSFSEDIETRPSSAIPFFRSLSDSPPPEPFDKPSVLDVQLVNMLKQNYDISKFFIKEVDITLCKVSKASI